MTEYTISSPLYFWPLRKVFPLGLPRKYQNRQNGAHNSNKTHFLRSKQGSLTHVLITPAASFALSFAMAHEALMSWHFFCRAMHTSRIQNTMPGAWWRRRGLPLMMIIVKSETKRNHCVCLSRASKMTSIKRKEGYEKASSYAPRACSCNF